MANRARQDSVNEDMIEADADPRGASQKFPWDQPVSSSSTSPRTDEKGENHAGNLTTDENKRLWIALGKLTSWLAGQAVTCIHVPEDVRVLVVKLPGSKALFAQTDLQFLDRLADLGAITANFKNEYLTQVRWALNTVVDWLIAVLADNSQIDRLIDWLIDWLVAWFFDWLIDWLIENETLGVFLLPLMN